jgi:hypothetical protein
VDESPILCSPNKETIIFQSEEWSEEELVCKPYPLSDFISVTIDDGKKNLNKDLPFCSRKYNAKKQPQQVSKPCCGCFFSF